MRVNHRLLPLLLLHLPLKLRVVLLQVLYHPRPDVLLEVLPLLLVLLLVYQLPHQLRLVPAQLTNEYSHTLHVQVTHVCYVVRHYRQAILVYSH
jgi:hypothetical protein